MYATTWVILKNQYANWKKDPPQKKTQEVIHNMNLFIW